MCTKRDGENGRWGDETRGAFSVQHVATNFYTESEQVGFWDIAEEAVAKRFVSLLSKNGWEPYFFAPRTASEQALAKRIFTTVLAGILIASPVAGLRPMRALRFTFVILPMPGMTKEPVFFV